MDEVQGKAIWDWDGPVDRTQGTRSTWWEDKQRNICAISCCSRQSTIESAAFKAC